MDWCKCEGRVLGVRWRWSLRWLFPKKGLVVGVARLVVWMLVGKAKPGEESVLVDCGGDWSAMLALLRMGRGSCDEGKEGGRGLLLVLTGLAVLESSSVMVCRGCVGVRRERVW